MAKLETSKTKEKQCLFVAEASGMELKNKICDKL